MEQTPAHDFANPDLLKLIPQTSLKLIEIGCSSGALAREFKEKVPNCHFVGLEIDPSAPGRFLLMTNLSVKPTLKIV